MRLSTSSGCFFESFVINATALIYPADTLLVIDAILARKRGDIDAVTSSTGFALSLKG
jgi:hypothetical protein